MAIATLVHRKTFSAAEWVAAAMVCLGLVLVGVADATAEGASFNPLGLSLVSLSVAADAVMPNVQQRLFARGESRADVVFFTNLATSAWMLASLSLSGDLPGALAVARADGICAAMMATYACVAYLAVSCHMSVVQRFGGVAGVLVGNGRKALTIALSVAIFPKPVSAAYVLGVLLSLGGLTMAVVLKDGNASGKGGGGGNTKRSRSGPDLNTPSSQAPHASLLPTCKLGDDTPGNGGSGSSGGHASPRLGSGANGCSRGGAGETWSATSGPC